MKICRRCTLTFLPEDFYVNRANKDGLDTYCRSCRKAYASETYARSGQRSPHRTRNVGQSYGYVRKNISAQVAERAALFDQGQRRCKTCGIIKDLQMFDRTNGRLNLRCRACLQRTP